MNLTDRPIFILTPWYGTASHFVDGYVKATASPNVAAIAWNNGVDDATLAALSAVQGLHIDGSGRNEGFAGGNAAAFALLPDEVHDDAIVLFLNNDITAPSAEWLERVRADVRHDGLYGPSLQQQLILGRWMPYLEGWCIAATMRTWRRLGGQRAWAADIYLKPYWEDNDLCFRALAKHGMALVQTAWPVQHIGGGTSGNLATWGEVLEANRATFVNRVRQVLPEPAPITEAHRRYLIAAHTPSDIQHHLGFLYSIATGVVVELGTRGGNSTRALLAGVERHGGHVTSIDIADCGDLFEDLRWTFVQGSSLDPAIADRFDAIDVLFVDTDHTFEQCAAELDLWGSKVREGGWIVGHDPETFPGVRAAFEAYAAAHGEALTIVTPCHGLAIIRKGVK